MFARLSVFLYVCAVLWITTHYSTSVFLSESLFISPSLQLPIAASKRQHSCHCSHLSEIYPAWSFGAQEGHRRPAHSHRILPGAVAWQHWLIGLARLRKGLARAGGIRSLPLIISCVCSSESWGRGRKIKALLSCLRGGYYAHRGAGRDTAGFVWFLSLTSHAAHRSVMLQLPTVACDMTEPLKRDLRH